MSPVNIVNPPEVGGEVSSMMWDSVTRTPGPLPKDDEEEEASTAANAAPAAAAPPIGAVRRGEEGRECPH